MAKMSKAIYLTSSETISISPPPAEVTNIKVESFNQQLKFTWTDPEDILAESININEWVGTIIVLNEEHPPIDQNDGRIVYTSKVKNQHQTNPCIISELVNGRTYYYGIFPYSVNNIYNINSIQTGEITLTALPPVKPPSEYTWEEIELIANEGFKIEDYWVAGENIYFAIGSITAPVSFIDGAQHSFILEDFLHDDLADGSGKASFSFISEDCMYDIKQMNATRTNTGGMPRTLLYDQLQNIVFNWTDNDFKPYIKEVKKKCSEGNKSSNIISYNAKLWIPTEIEMFGSTRYSAIGEGEHYPRYTNDHSRVKWRSGSPEYYWLASPNINNPYNFSLVSPDGGINTRPAEHMIGVAFGFCVGNGGNEPDDGEFTVVFEYPSDYPEPNKKPIAVRTINQKIPLEKIPEVIAAFGYWMRSTEYSKTALADYTLSSNVKVRIHISSGGTAD